MPSSASFLTDLGEDFGKGGFFISFFGGVVGGISMEEGNREVWA